MGRSGCKKSVKKMYRGKAAAASQGTASHPASQWPSQPYQASHPASATPPRTCAKKAYTIQRIHPNKEGKKVSCCSFCSLAIAHTFFTLFLQPPIQPHFFHTFHLQLFRTTFFLQFPGTLFLHFFHKNNYFYPPQAVPEFRLITLPFLLHSIPIPQPTWWGPLPVINVVTKPL